MLIVEGPDMVGKTELCLALVRAMRADPRWAGEPVHYERFTHKDAQTMAQQLRNRMARSTVSDRGWHSEVLYAVHARQSDPSMTRAETAEAMGRLWGSQVAGMCVVVHAGVEAYERLTEAHHARGELYDRQACARVAKAYHTMALGSYLGASRVTDRQGAGRLLPVDSTFEVRLDGSGGITYPSSDVEFVRGLVDEYARRQGKEPRS